MSHHKEISSHKQDRLQLISEIASGVGHDLGNPLAVIRGYLQILERKAAPELQHYLTISLKELDQVVNVLQTFFQLIKEQQGKVEAQSVNQIILSICPLIASLFKKNTIDLDLQLTETLPDLMLQKQEVQQVLLKLIQYNLTPNSSLQITTTMSNANIQVNICKKGLIPCTPLDLTICAEILTNYQATIDSHYDKTSCKWLLTFPLA